MANLVAAAPLVGAGLTGVAVLQDKPGWIIFGGGVFAAFAYVASEFRMSGDAPGPFKLWYEECAPQYGTDEHGLPKQLNTELCREEFNLASAAFYASAATVAWGLYRASEKGL